jgi:dTDP-glucose 4,6-dehydratase
VFRNGVHGEVYNIGGNCEHSNNEMTVMLLELTGRNESAIEHVADRRGHDFRYAINTAKICKLGWKPQTTLHDGLERTVRYFRSKTASVE